MRCASRRSALLILLTVLAAAASAAGGGNVQGPRVRSGASGSQTGSYGAVRLVPGSVGASGMLLTPDLHSPAPIRLFPTDLSVLTRQPAIPDVTLAAPPASPGPAGTQSGSADAAARSVHLDIGGLGHVVFDVRGSRGGKGDVAAAYLTAADMLARGRVEAGKGNVPSLTFIAGDSELKILSGLTGNQVRIGDTLFDGAAKVVTIESIRDLPPADVYMALAAADGRGVRSHSFVVDSKSAELTAVPIKLGGGVLINQTVFGNTESRSQSPGSVVVDGRRLDISPAGIAPEESGVYADPIARELKGRTDEEIRRYIVERLPDGPGAQGLLKSQLKGEALVGAAPVLIYGVSLAAVKPQLRGYLQGLVAKAVDEKGSYLIVTPSSIKPEDVKDDAALLDHVVFLDPQAALPANAEPGKIYVLGTGALPHPVFIGLMAYSRPPPIVAGDGALSAAIELARPFVMTHIGWNSANVDAYKRRLIAATADPFARSVINAVFTYDPQDQERPLRYAQYLADQREAFAAASAAVPVLTDALLGAVRAARFCASAGVDAEQVMGFLPDPLFRNSVIVDAAKSGDVNARAQAVKLMRSRSFSRQSDLLVELVAHLVDVLGAGALDALEPLPLEEVKGTARADQVTSVVLFKNRTDREMRVYWLDPEGNRHFYSKIDPGDRVFQQSWEGDVWVVTDSYERPMRAFRTAGLPGVASVPQEAVPKEANIRDKLRALAEINKPADEAVPDTPVAPTVVNPGKTASFIQSLIKAIGF